MNAGYANLHDNDHRSLQKSPDIAHSEFAIVVVKWTSTHRVAQLK